MLQNAIAGLQGIIDHVMVGHFVGYTANAFAFQLVYGPPSDPKFVCRWRR